MASKTKISEKPPQASPIKDFKPIRKQQGSKKNENP
jgi:hypothetical protein